MSLPIRPGMTVPLPGPLHSHREKLGELADMGYTDIWSAESDGADGFTPLALAAAWEPRLRLGTAIIPAYTRSPACFAQSVASLADAAPGRFAIGIGSSSNVIVERWNGIPFVEPYKKVRDVVRFLKDAFTYEKVAKTYDTFEVNGFKLGVRPEQPPQILVAALRDGHVAPRCPGGRRRDHQLVVTHRRGQGGRCGCARRQEGEDKEIVARIFVCPSENADVVRAAARFAIAAYMNVPVYAAFHEWLGRGPQMQGMWGCLEGGGPQRPRWPPSRTRVVDDLVVHGARPQRAAPASRSTSTTA